MVTGSIGAAGVFIKRRRTTATQTGGSVRAGPIDRAAYRELVSTCQTRGMGLPTATVESFTGEMENGEGYAQLPNSLQVTIGSSVSLSWEVSDADSVELTDPAAGAPLQFSADTSSTTVTPQSEEQDYVLVALSGGQRSAPSRVHVSTHAPDFVVSAHAFVAAPSAALSGSLANEDGTALPRWPFQLFDASGAEITPDALAQAGGSADPAPAAGAFVSGPDASYSIQGAPAGASAQPVAPLAPIDTSSDPVPAEGGTAESDGGAPHRFLSWIKTEATDAMAVVKDDAGEAVGYAELLGLRYPVKAYQAQVSSTLTRGSRLDTAGLQDLASRGFHGVVNFCKEYDDSAAVTAAGMNPLHLSVLDNTAPTYDEIKQFLDFVTAPANQPAYCHCEAGVGRTGVFCASYRIAVSGFTTAQAIAEAAKYGLSLQSQIQFLQKLGPDILAGKIAGYPVSGGP